MNILALKLSSFGYWQGDRGFGLYSLAVLCSLHLGHSLVGRLEGRACLQDTSPAHRHPCFSGAGIKELPPKHQEAIVKLFPESQSKH